MTAYRTWTSAPVSTTLAGNRTDSQLVNDVDQSGSVQIVGVTGKAPTTASMTLKISNNNRDWINAPASVAPDGATGGAGSLVRFNCGPGLYMMLEVGVAEADKEFIAEWLFRPNPAAVAAKV